MALVGRYYLEQPEAMASSTSAAAPCSGVEKGDGLPCTPRSSKLHMGLAGIAP